MCLIIAVQNTREMSVEDFTTALESAVWFNPDGIGIAFASQGKAEIIKRVKDYGTVIDLAVELYQSTNDPFVVHLRYNTVGENSTANTHPFRVSRSIAMVHNKTLDIEPPVRGWSDSRTVAELLRRLCKADKQFFNSSLFYSFIEHHAALDNRFVFLDAEDNSLTFINEHLGTTHQGVWFSNLYSWTPALLGIGRKSKQNKFRDQLELVSHDIHEEELDPFVDAWEDDQPLAWQPLGGRSAVAHGH